MTDSQWDLRGKKFVLTGGSKGIGFATCSQLLGKGASVFFCGQGETEVQQKATELAQFAEHGASVRGCACDISSNEGRKLFVQNIKSTFGSAIDGLINNVGCNVRAPIEVNPNWL